MWILDHLDDLDADFRVFYRIDDIESLSGPRFMALAMRVFAYQGVMAARAAELQQDHTPMQAAQPQQQTGEQLVSPEAFAAMFPDLVTISGGGER